MTKPIEPVIHEIKIPKEIHDAIGDIFDNITASRSEPESRDEQEIRAQCVIDALREDLASERAISEARVKRLIEARIIARRAEIKAHEAREAQEECGSDHDHLGSDFDEFFGRIMHEHNLSATADVRDGIVWLSKAVQTANVRRNAVLGLIQQVLECKPGTKFDNASFSFDQVLLTIGCGLNGDLQAIRKLARLIQAQQEAPAPVPDIAPPVSPDDVPPADENPL